VCQRCAGARCEAWVWPGGLIRCSRRAAQRPSPAAAVAAGTGTARSRPPATLRLSSYRPARHWPPLAQPPQAQPRPASACSMPRPPATLPPQRRALHPAYASGRVRTVFTHPLPDRFDSAHLRERWEKESAQALCSRRQMCACWDISTRPDHLQATGQQVFGLICGPAR